MITEGNIREIYDITGLTPLAGGYEFTFPYTSAQDVRVYTTGNRTDTEVSTSNYTIDESGATPKVVFIAGYSFPAGQTKLTIIRNVSYSQKLDLRNGDLIDADKLEGALDNITQQIQQVAEKVDRAILSSVSDTEPLSIPEASQRNNMLLGFDSEGKAIPVLTTDIEQKLAQALAAEESAITAKNAAENAQHEAESAQSAAETAQGKAETAQAAAESAEASSQTLLASIETKTEESIASINTTKTGAVGAVTTQQATSVAAVQAAQNTAESDIAGKRSSALTAIDTAKTTAVAAVNTQKETSVAAADREIVAKRDSALTDIQTARTNAVNAITTKKDQSLQEVEQLASERKAEINSLAANQKADVKQYTDSVVASAKTEIDTEKTTAVTAVQEEGDAKVAIIGSSGDAEVTRVQSVYQTDLNELKGDIANIEKATESVIHKEVISTETIETNIFPETGWEFGEKTTYPEDIFILGSVPNTNVSYTQEFDVLPNTRYILSFKDAPYSGGGMSPKIAIFYGNSESGDLIKFKNCNGTETPSLVSGSFTSNVGGKDYVGFFEFTTSDVKTIRFLVNAGFTVEGRAPTGWSLTQYVVHAEYDYSINSKFKDKATASLNLFVKDESSSKEIVYLGKDANGNEMHGWYLGGTGGVSTVVSSTGLDSTSARIEIKPDTKYWKSETTMVNFFDENDCWISGIGNGKEKRSITSPSNAKYIRISFPSELINYTQLLEGEEEKEYTVGAYAIKGFSSEKNDEINRVLNRGALTFDWMEDYIRDVAFEAEQYITDKTHTSIFITDTHPDWVTVRFIASASNMTKYVPAKYIVHGGDIIDGQTNPENEKRMLTLLNRYAQESLCPVFYCKGNHDDAKIYAHITADPTQHFGKSSPGMATDYVTNMELYKRTNAFVNKADVVWGNKERMFGYFDDEETKIRTIIVNAFDNPETVDGNGKRIEDSNTPNVPYSQFAWIGDVALRFDDKPNKSEWAVIFYAHSFNFLSRYTIGGIACAFKEGTKYDQNAIEYHTDFSDQGAMEVIAIICGDAHFDALRKATYSGYYNDTFVTNIVSLNASLGRDNTNAATTDNSILYPPKKYYGTENETAFDIVTIDRENTLIYLTRYGARSYSYNTETEQFDTVVNRTRIINYSTGEYVQLL